MDILKEIMKHRQRVSIKLSSVANDIAARGRRHDNSYTESVEYNLIEKYTKTSDDEDKERYLKLLKDIHSERNDYLPEYHGGIDKMNMIQLLELIAERIVLLDERYGSNDIELYKSEIIENIGPISDDLKGVIENTIEYFINRNASILKSLQKSIDADSVRD